MFTGLHQPSFALPTRVLLVSLKRMTCTSQSKNYEQWSILSPDWAKFVQNKITTLRKLLKRFPSTK